MFYLPGFDPKTMTEEEMFVRQQEIARKIVYAQKFGLAPEMISTFQLMSMAIDNERRERHFHEAWKVRDSMFPDVIETDPDLAAKEPAAQVKTPDDKKPPSARPRVSRPVPTAVPVTPSPEPLPTRRVAPKGSQ